MKKIFFLMIIFAAILGLFTTPAMADEHFYFQDPGGSGPVYHLDLMPGPFGPGESGKANLYTDDGPLAVFDYQIDDARPDVIVLPQVGIFQRGGQDGGIEFFSFTGLTFKEGAGP